MKRIFILEPSLLAAHETLRLLRSMDVSTDHIHVVAGERWREEVLPGNNATLDEVTDVVNAQVRGSAVGATAGALTALGLTWIPGASFAAATALMLGGSSGASLGLVIGTLIGVEKKHPVVEEFSTAIDAGKVLIAADLAGNSVDEVITQIESQAPLRRVFTRQFLGIKELESAA